MKEFKNENSEIGVFLFCCSQEHHFLRLSAENTCQMTWVNGIQFLLLVLLNSPAKVKS